MSLDGGLSIRGSVTPNPDAMKFTLDRVILESGSRSYASRFEAMDDPLGSALFEIPGVTAIFYMADFVTVTKESTAAWEGISRAVEEVIKRHLTGR